ncbi:MAG: hypothetical protein A2340_14435 [Lentisphaerae bacterium RIFOXYB12_FULL_60_10]|nr:MAG: hypothetical protein A2269_08060 [Lentisphaerae bacterium RIFOXYA12_FULL_60_10]OGV83004.1 MAG: hypothetical protein A2340_14435 [Lentisphaerae bacterium RIFOXYB12_FULL_60_10]
MKRWTDIRRQSGTMMVLLTVVIISLPVVCLTAGKPFFLTQLTMSAYYTMVVMGLCMLLGHAGQASLGHAAFFAIGGYASARLTTLNLAGAISPRITSFLGRLHVITGHVMPDGITGYSITPWVALLFALALACLIAGILGYPALRLRGHYLAMATLGFGLIVYRILLGTAWLGSADGITEVPPLILGPDWRICGDRNLRVQNYYLAWGLVLALYIVLQNLIHSRVGRALRAIHDNETAASCVGIRTEREKLKIFILSAAIAALAGSLFTHYTGGIGPSEAGAGKSIRYLALVAAGGMSSMTGCLLVSAGVNFFSLRGYFGSMDHAVFGFILIVMVSGFAGAILQTTRRWSTTWVSRIRNSRQVHGT